MNETTKKALEEFVTKMLSAVEQGATWTADQAPLVVQEWLRWEIVSNAAWAVLWLLPFVGVWKFSGVLVRAEHDEEANEAGWGIRIMVGGALLCLSLWNVMDAVKAAVAPRVVVLEKFADLLK